MIFCASFFVVAQAQETESQNYTYHIQISASKTFTDPAEIQLKSGIAETVKFRLIDGWYKYYVGSFKTNEEANDYRRENSITGFVVRYTKASSDDQPAVKEKSIDAKTDITKAQQTIKQPAEDSEKVKNALGNDSTKIFLTPVDQLTSMDTLYPQLIHSDTTEKQQSEILEIFSPRPGTENTGFFEDSRDNIAYTWVRVGNQTWMAENVRHATNSHIVPKVDQSEGSTAGYLYNYSDAKEICPPGWHLPSDAEWLDLERSIGLENSEINSLGDRTAGNPGIQLKSKEFWNDEGFGVDRYGLNIQPSGYVTQKGKVVKTATSSYFWTSSSTIFGILIRSLRSDSNGISRGLVGRHRFQSVRCLKDTVEEVQ